MASAEPEGHRKPDSRALAARDAAWAGALFVLLLAIYQVNGGIPPGGDAKPNTYLAGNLLAHGSLHYGHQAPPPLRREPARAREPDLHAARSTVYVQVAAAEARGTAARLFQQMDGQA